MIGQIKQRQSLENKNKILYFETHFPTLHRMINGNYLEQQVVIYVTLITNIKALMSAFCVVGNCPIPPIITEQKRSKEVKMFLINHDMH